MKMTKKLSPKTQGLKFDDLKYGEIAILIGDVEPDRVCIKGYRCISFPETNTYLTINEYFALEFRRLNSGETVTFTGD